MPKKMKKDSLYYQIQEEIKEDIQNLKLKEGDKIMSESEICNHYGVSRITAKRALNDLEEEGYIKRIPGKGSFVNFHILEMHMTKCYSYTEEMIVRGKETTSQTLEGRIVKVEETPYFREIQKRTFWDNSEKVYYIKRIRYVDGLPAAISETCIPLYIFSQEEQEKLKNYSYNKINYMIYTKVKERQAMSKRAIEDITAVNLEEKDAKLLGISRDVPVIRTDRTVFTDESVLEYIVYHNLNLTYRYHMEFANTDAPLRKRNE